MSPFTIAKLVGGGLIVLIVGVLLWTVREELIQKGENIIKAQDNAALVKAQKDQIANDARLVSQQKEYIAELQASGTQIKERIRVVAAPCAKDGADDPRLRDTVDWLRGRGTPNSLPAGGGPAAQGTVPPPRLPPASR